MSPPPSVVLKPGKERSILARHPWVFSGAIATRPVHEPGEIFPVYTSHHTLLGHGYFHPTSSIAGRMINFTEKEPLESLAASLKEAIALRTELSPFQGRRLVNGEGDALPGLIIDQYCDVLVMQSHTAGIDRLKPWLITQLVQELHPRTIYEKSTSSSRRQEGLQETRSLLWGVETPEVVIEEHGAPFIVQPLLGQKTGFFLDQREMRRHIMKLAANKNVLNCFAYTGGFSVAALRGGAHHVTSVDISEGACTLARRNTLAFPNHTVITADVFDLLQKDPLNYNLVILDPPAFAKQRSHVQAASNAYRRLNQLVLHKLPPHSCLLTSSCSSYIDPSLFQQLIFQAALSAGRHVRILSRHHHSLDHPISLYHPEGDYLKSLLLYIS